MPAKFCPECGTALEPGSRFCTGCGSPAGGAPRTGSLPLAGVVSLVVLLVLGGGFWLYSRLAPETPRPLKPGEGRTASAPSGEAAPPDAAGAPHPPIALPDDIKQYIDNLAKDAAAKPKDVEAWQTLARVYYRASRLDPNYAPEAEKAFRHLLDLDAKNLEGLRGLGNVAYDKQDRATAISYYEKYLVLKPEDPEVRTDLATMLFETGKSDEAIAQYEKVIEKNPAFFQAYFNLGVVYDQRGDRALARAQLEKARDLAPDDGVKQRIVALLAAAKDGKSFAEAAASLAPPAPPAGAMAGATAGAPGPGPAGSAGSGPAAPAAPAAGAPPAAAATSFAGGVEQLFRSHPIAGPKVVAIEWPSPGQGRVVMAAFPMDAMPEAMRNSYLDKMRKGVGDARTRFGQEGPVQVEIVDQATGKVMATVTP